MNTLGAELSLSSRLVTPSPELNALAAASGDVSLSSHEEPYRQALKGVYARLFASLKNLAGTANARRPHREMPPYLRPEELLADLSIVDASLRNHGSERLVSKRLEPLMRTVEVR